MAVQGSIVVVLVVVGGNPDKNYLAILTRVIERGQQTNAMLFFSTSAHNNVAASLNKCSSYFAGGQMSYSRPNGGQIIIGQHRGQLVATEAGIVWIQRWQSGTWILTQISILLDTFARLMAGRLSIE